MGDGARQGHVGAQLRLAALHAAGRGVPQDDDQAAHWLRKAAEQSSPAAQCCLASMLLEGRAEPRTGEDATELLARAAQAGWAEAQFLLGRTQLSPTSLRDKTQRHSSIAAA